MKSLLKSLIVIISVCITSVANASDLLVDSVIKVFASESIYKNTVISECF